MKNAYKKEAYLTAHINCFYMLGKQSCQKLVQLATTALKRAIF
jgi:hypothetical protein